MKTRIGVIVRQRHIDRGRCRSPKSCPIALAMKEQLGTDKVKVYADGVFVDEQKYWIPFRARTLLCVSRPKLGINQQTVKEDPMSPNVSRCLCAFIVVMYDVTASFTHWGMYNIASTTTSLPQNAGVVGSTYGTQIYNDFGDPSYDGPCPPTTMTPLSHQYVVTVYALK